MKKFCLSLCILFTAFILQAQTTPAPDTLQQYTGKYKFPEGSVVTEVTVALESGVLKASSIMGSTELRLTQGDVFEIVVYSGTATFRRNAEGKIMGVQMVVGDINIEGTKTEGLTFDGIILLPAAIKFDKWQIAL
jgi:hypothetical protein